ncbi:MAG: hypothetical protein R2730_03965 [Chitinophagales bacterium]
MHHYTKTKIRDIRKYLKQHYKEIVNEYNGVVGLHVAKKTRDGKPINRYCLVVRVKKKKPEESLKHVIPKYFEIPSSVPKVKTHMVPTDIVEVGEAEFNSILTETDFGHQIFEGSVSTYISKEDKVYILSCMHVFGGEYIDEQNGGSVVFDEPDNDNQNIFFDDFRIAILKKGVFLPHEGVDIAMAELDSLDSIEGEEVYPLQYNHLANNDYIEKACFDGYLIHTDGAYNKSDSMVMDPDTPTRLKFNNQFDVDFDNVIALYGKISTNGDSGGLVYDEYDIVYGIILGSDNLFTYVIKLIDAIEYL